MATFTYTAMDVKGKEVKGTIECASEAAALTAIREKNLFPTAVTEVGANKKKAATTGEKTSGMIEKKQHRKKKKKRTGIQLHSLSRFGFLDAFV